VSTTDIDNFAGQIIEAEERVNTAKRSLAQQILAAADVESKLLPVPEWNGITLELRSPTGEERAALVSAFINVEETAATGVAKMNDLTRMYPALIISCAYDPETGERVFPAMDDSTVAALNAKNGAVLERIAMACMPLVGLSPDSVEETKGGSSTSHPNENGSS
jgi:hypothetical protein